MPSVRGVKDILKVGAGVGIGYVGVNGVRLLADKVLGSFKAGQSPTVVALINAGVGAFIGVPVAGMLGKAVLGQKWSTPIYAGAAWNVVQHAARELGAQTGAIPDWGQALLLDYDSGARGMFDYINAGTRTGMRDYLLDNGLPSSQMPSEINYANDNTPDQVGAFI